MFRLVIPRGFAGGVWPHRFGAGPVSLQRRVDDLRSTVDGSAGHYLPWRDLCEPAFAESFVERWADGDDHSQSGRVRGIGGDAGQRFAAIGGAAGWPARANGGLTAV